MTKTAIVTGITGQDGSIVSDQLIEQGYTVYGLLHRSSSPTLSNSNHLVGNPNFKVVEGDLLDVSSLVKVCNEVRADLFFNCAAMSVHPESLIYLHLTGRYTKIQTIEDLWNNKYRQTKLSLRKELCQSEGGPIEVEVLDMSKNTQLKTLGYKNGMGQWCAIKQISRHKYKGKLVKLTQKWGEVCVTPNHSVYDSQNNLKSPLENPELLAMRKINYFNISPKTQIKLNIKNDFISNILKEESLQGFLEFLGAFISEGWTTFNKANNSYHVCIAQQDKSWLEYLQQSISKFYKNKSWICRHKKIGYKDVFRLEIHSKDLYLWLRKNCGTQSNNKKIPDFFFELKQDLWDYLLKFLIDGDGHKYYWKNYVDLSYSSTSSKLISQLSLIWTYLGIDYSYGHYKYKEKKWKDKYTLKQVRYYNNQIKKKYEEIDYEGYVYDISVDEVHNFIIGTGNIVVHNSHVGTSFNQPAYTAQVTGLGVLNCLEAIRMSGIHTKFLQYSTSEMFGGLTGETANEETPFHPRSPYGVSKLFGYWITRNYRESYKMFASNAIFFNHEGTRRHHTFVTRKITRAVASIAAGKQDELWLGNLDASRDWGWAPDYMSGAIDILTRATEPDDFVLATGETHSVREFCEEAFKCVNLDYRDWVKIDPAFYRPAEVHVLVGDYSKIQRVLGWKPTTTFKDLVRKMVEHDLSLEGLTLPAKS